jgi:hypothetical protein
MTVLSDSQIAQLAINAGFDNTQKNSRGDTQVAIAVMVAIAESKGDTQAHNSFGADDSYGLWQINMKGNLGPGRRAAFGISSNEQLFDPATNAKAAKMIFDGSGWNAWTTYLLGVYGTYRSRGQQAAANPTDPGGTPPIAGGPDQVITSNFVTDALKAVLSFFIDLLKPLFLRMATFIGGGVLVILAIVIYIKQRSK